MKKIAYMFGGMNRGGAETIMLDVFRNWRNAPFGFIGIHRKGGTMRDAFYAAGPKLYQLSPRRFGYVRYLLPLRRLIKSENITTIHAQHWLDTIYAWLATIGMDVQLVTTLHGFYPMKGLNGFLCRMSIRMSDDVCFVSRYEQEWYQQQMHIPDTKCHVIYNGVDLNKFDVASESVIELGNEGRIKLCMVGSFSPARNHLLVCHALNLLPRKADLYFIGAKNEHIFHCYKDCYEYCKTNNILDNVHFIGEQSNVYAWLERMDGFVFATQHDTFGISLIEAMAVGLPVIVSDWEVMKEICAPFTKPFVQMFRMDDAHDCAKKMLYLIDHLHECQQAALNQSMLAQEYYSMDAYFTRLIKIYTYHDII